MAFQLALHGDRVEQAAWPLFVRDRFPEYEVFWQLFVVPLTNRVTDANDVSFRAQPELDQEGRPAWHVAVAQLHYTTLLHLLRAWEIRQRRVAFIEAIARLSAATDTAFELLGRCLNGKEYAAWSENAGKDARREWFVTFPRWRSVDRTSKSEQWTERYSSKELISENPCKSACWPP